MWSMRNDSLVNLQGRPGVRGLRHRGAGAGLERLRRRSTRRARSSWSLVNDPGLQDSTIFRGQDPHLLRPMDLQDRGGAASGRRRHPHRPYDRERDLSVDHRAVRVGRSAGPLETPASSLVVAGWLQQDAAARLFRQGGQDLAALSEAAGKRDSSPYRSTLQFDATVRSAIRRSETANVLGPLARARAARARGRAHRRALRPLRDRRPGGRRLDLQRRRGQRLWDGRGAGHGRGLRPERSPPRALTGLRRVRGRGIGADRLPGPGRPPRRSRSRTWPPS